MPERAVLAERDLAHVVVVADAHHHEFLALGGLLRRRGAACRRTASTHLSAFAAVRL